MLSSSVFFSGYKSLRWVYVFYETDLQCKTFDVWRYRIEHSDVASWRPPNEPRDVISPEIYSRFMETEDVASFVAALKAQVAI